MKLTDLGFDLGPTKKTFDVNAALKRLGEDLGAVSGDADERIHTLPPIEEWVNSPYYIGDWALHWEKGGLYPAARKSVIEAWQPQYTEVILSGSAGASKCLAGDTLVPDPETGRLTQIRDCSERRTVLSLDEADGKVGSHLVADFIPSGVKPTVRLETASGREVVTTLTHRYLTDTGWKPVTDLRTGDFIAVPRRIPIEGKVAQPVGKMELLGMLVSDGGLTNGSPRWTCADPILVAAFKSRMCEFFHDVGENMHLNPGTEIDYMLVTVRDHNNGGRPNPLKTWLKEVGLWGKHSPSRVVPDIVFESTNESVCAFLRGLYSGDGYVAMGSRTVGYGTASKRLGEGIRHLLLRLGIQSRFRYKKAKCGGKEFDSWLVDISGRDNVRNFAKQIGFIGERAQKLAKVCVELEDVISNTNVDVVPGFWCEVEKVKNRLGLGWIELAEKCGWKCHPRVGRAASAMAPFSFRDRGKTRLPSRQLAQKIAFALGDETLIRMATSDIFWDRVKVIAPAGETDVYDLCVPGPENFVAADIVCHNTQRACLLLLRLLHELLCYKKPGKALGLSSVSKLVIAFASVSKTKSKEVGYDRFAAMVKASPFIMENFPPNPKYTGKVLFDNHNIECKPVISGERGILSEDIIGLLIDEAAFMDVTEKSKKARGEEQTYDSAASLYHQAKARMDTRFRDLRRQMPGKVIIASSAQFPDDFVSRRRLQVAQDNDPTVYVSDLAIWEAKPDVMYSKQTFRVEIGDENRFSRILDDGQDERPGARVINVPVDLKKRFEDDIDRAIRDLAGVPLLTLSPLISNREAVRRCIRTIEGGYGAHQTVHPWGCDGVSVDTTTLEDGCDFIWNLLCVQDSKGLWQPREGVDKFRVIHYDPSFVNDATGFAMAHPTTVATVAERDHVTGETHMVQKVGVYIDAMLRVTCPDEPGAEISWPALERLAERLQDHGFDIALVTSDSPAGRVFVQRFREIGFHAETASVDKTPEPYLTLKKLINEGLISYYEYEPFIRELYRLEWNKRKNKVDHPRHMSGGHRPSKDVADAVAMCAYNIATRYDEFETSGPAISFGAF